MEAKDTVMKPQELIRREDIAETNTDIEASLHRQAEISFPAGIKEVVAWVNSKDLKDPYYMGIKFDVEWQSKLKEWGC